MESIYVYYKIGADTEAHAFQAAAAVLDDVAQRCGLRGRLMRRRDDRNTWMEVYEDVDRVADFESALAAAVAASEFAHSLKTMSRHLERFVALEMPPDAAPR